MLTYCFKCKKNPKKHQKKPRVSGFKATQTQNGRTMLLSKCAVRNKKNQDLWENKKQKEYKVV